MSEKDYTQDTVDIVLLKQRIEMDEVRIASLEKVVAALDRKVLTGQIAVVGLIMLGTFFGYIVTVAGGIKTWLTK